MSVSVGVSVLVPLGGPRSSWRAKAFDYVTRHYYEHHPDWELIVGMADDEWSKGVAVADAYRHATGEMLVIADADSFVRPEALVQAVDDVAETGTWAVPHGRVYRLNQRATEIVYAGGPVRKHMTARLPYIGPAGGGIVVLTRAAYDKVGGIDERFCGWGGEDISLGWALGTLVGPYTRVGAPLIHLWHPHPAPTLRGCPESEALAGRYREARGKPEAMAALVARMTA